MDKNKKYLYLVILCLIVTGCILVLLYFIPKFISRTVKESYQTGIEGVKDTYQAGKEIAKDIGRAVDNIFHIVPVITYNNTLILSGNAPILELSTVEQSILHEYKWEHEWLMSKKEIRIKGYLTAKAGFKLHEYFNIDIIDNSQGTYSVNIYLPQPSLLSMELQPNFEVWTEHGWWNKISDEERNFATNTFLNEAKIRITQGNIFKTAIENIENTLNNIIKARLKDVQIFYHYEKPPRG